MEMVPVNSSTIASAGYDEPSRTLRIEFKNGSAYEYFDVPVEVFRTLVDPGAGSAGRFFSSSIKGIYRYSRL